MFQLDVFSPQLGILKVHSQYARFWYGSDINGTRAKFIPARTTYLQGPKKHSYLKELSKL